MYVLISDVPSMDLEFLPPCNHFEHALELCFDVWIAEHLASVLRAPYDMVVAHPCCVGLLIQASVGHGESPLVDTIDHGDFLMGYAFTRTHRLKPVVFGVKKSPYEGLIEATPKTMASACPLIRFDASGSNSQGLQFAHDYITTNADFLGNI